MDPNILSDELRAMLPNDGTPLVLPSRQQKKRKRGASKPEADARPLSKSQQRKLRKLQVRAHWTRFVVNYAPPYLNMLFRKRR